MRSPALNERSPLACAVKSYKATTYCTGGAIFGFDLSGGGGGGGLLLAAAVAAPATPEGVYGGGAAFDDELGGGGAAFLNEETLEVDLMGGDAL
jgi:hypothetical protein